MLLFNATTSSVKNVTAFVAGPLISIAAWINPNGWGEGGQGAVFMHGTSWEFGINNGVAIFFRPEFSTTAGFYSVGAPALGTMYHIGVTYDGGSVSNYPVFYINGVRATPVTRNQTPVGTISNASGSIVVGQNTNLSTETFDGIIGEVALWMNKQLTDVEMAAVWRRGPLAVQSAALRIYWPMDERTGNVLDYSGNGYVGTPANIAYGYGGGVGMPTFVPARLAGARVMAY